MKANYSLRNVCWFGFACWAAGIFWLSSLNGAQLDPVIPAIRFSDKICHAIAFGIGAVLLAAALRETKSWSWKKLLSTAIAAISFYGMTDEIHQLWTPGRSGADVFDWLADTAGATLGAFIVPLIHGTFRDSKSFRASHQTAAGN